jgi:hypothetical protein
MEHRKSCPRHGGNARYRMAELNKPICARHFVGQTTKLASNSGGMA